MPAATTGRDRTSCRCNGPDPLSEGGRHLLRCRRQHWLLFADSRAPRRPVRQGHRREPVPRNAAIIRRNAARNAFANRAGPGNRARSRARKAELHMTSHPGGATLSTTDIPPDVIGTMRVRCGHAGRADAGRKSRPASADEDRCRRHGNRGHEGHDAHVRRIQAGRSVRSRCPGRRKCSKPSPPRYARFWKVTNIGFIRLRNRMNIWHGKSATRLRCLTAGNVSAMSGARSSGVWRTPRRDFRADAENRG